MFKLQLAIAVAITAVWAGVVFVAVRNPQYPELVTLATVVTPVMLLPAGWLFAAPVLRYRRFQNGRRPEDDRDKS